MEWSFNSHTSDSYRHKFENTVAVLNEWVGGFAGKSVLEFGCGAGAMAWGVALQHGPSRFVGVEISSMVADSLEIARKHIGVTALPPNFHLDQIKPGADLSEYGYGSFDVIYSWSVFEHVAPELLSQSLDTIRRLLKPTGVFMMQIAPLYYARDGAHLSPWVPLPWSHLRLTDRELRERLFAAPPVPEKARGEWTSYRSLGHAEQRQSVWDTYETLNKMTAPKLEWLAAEAGFKIVRDHRTSDDDPIPDRLLDTFHESILRTNQVAWLLTPR